MAKAIYKVGVVGGGVMGRGIALLVSQSGLPVIVKEVNRELADKCLRSVHDKLDSAVSRGKLMSDKADMAKALVSATADFNDLSDVDLVIEAVFENMEAKKKVFGELDGVVSPDSIFATNSSSLSITDMASVTLRPDKFIGMHFFNPPVTMSLVELIRANMTSDDTFEAVADFAKNSLGKITVQVKECPAFLVNRLLMPYVNEAVYLLSETTLTAEEIDSQARNFGWPMGPLALLDYVGIDVAGEVAKICHAGYGDRAKPAPLMSKLVELGRFGNKVGAGFYVNNPDGRFEDLKSIINREFPNRKVIDPEEGFRRTMISMVNEAFMCLEEGIASPEDIDTGCKYGIGFPGTLEGPLHWAESQGLGLILSDLNIFYRIEGQRFKPAKLLEEYCNEGKEIFGGW